MTLSHVDYRVVNECDRLCFRAIIQYGMSKLKDGPPYFSFQWKIHPGNYLTQHSLTIMIGGGLG